MRRFYLAAMLAALTIVLAASAAAGQLPQELVARYRPAVERIQEGYTKITVRGVSTVAYPQQDRSRKQEFIMRAGGKLRRLDLKTIAQNRMGLQVGATEMRMATPWGSLITTTPKGHKFFDDAKELSYDATVAEIDQGSLMNYPYSITPGTTILDMLLSPNVEVVKVDNVEASGEKLVQIAYRQYATYAGRSGQWNCRLTLSPREGWALRSFMRSLGRDSNQFVERASLSYSGVQDGVPLVAAIESETLQGSETIERRTIQVDQITLGEPDKYYFDSWTF